MAFKEVPNTLVIHTPLAKELVAFFEGFGFQFVEEQHGTGKKHKAAMLDGRVLEIYPSDFEAQRVALHYFPFPQE